MSENETEDRYEGHRMEDVIATFIEDLDAVTTVEVERAFWLGSMGSLKTGAAVFREESEEEGYTGEEVASIMDFVRDHEFNHEEHDDYDRALFAKYLEILK